MKPESIRVSAQEIEEASARLSEKMKNALEQAYANISKFHKAQKPQPIKVETQPGVLCEQVTRPIQKVGLYIPGGSAPLPSTVLMLGVPAHIAGCRKVVLCSPRNRRKICMLLSCAALMKYTTSVVVKPLLRWLMAQTVSKVDKTARVTLTWRKQNVK